MGTQQLLLLSFINFETRKNSAPDHSYQDPTSRSFDTFLDFHQISADKVFIALCIHSFTWSEPKPRLLEFFLEIPLGVLLGQATRADWLDLYSWRC